MNIEIFLVNEDLVQRELPKHTIKSMVHPVVVLPFRRNALTDGYAFAIRCTSGEGRTQIGVPPRPQMYPFEAYIPWLDQDNIAMLHNLMPVPKTVLTRHVGRVSLSAPETAEIQRFFEGMLWNESVGAEILSRTSRDKLDMIPQQVRDARPGDIIEIDGAPGIVVSTSIFNRRHKLGSLALVPLARPDTLTAGDQDLRALAPVPELLKVCQPFAGIHEVRLTGDNVGERELSRLSDQVRMLLQWDDQVASSTENNGRRFPNSDVMEACLFSANTRPHYGPEPRSVGSRSRRKATGASAALEPVLLDTVRYEGDGASLRAEVWNHQGTISLQLVAEDGVIEVIDLVAALAEDRSIEIAKGPVWPKDWVYSLRLGAFGELLGKAIEIIIRVPGITAEYAIRIVQPDGDEEGDER